MRLTRGTVWLGFSAASAGILAALAWVTITTLSLERAKAETAARAAHQETVGLALWQMDSWLAPMMAREAARPPEEYLSYYRPERIYTRMLSQIEPGEVLTRSPLLTARPLYVRIYFQLEASGELTSPQVPRGNLRDLAEIALLGSGEVDRNQSALDVVARLIAGAELDVRLDAAEFDFNYNFEEETEGVLADPDTWQSAQQADLGTKQTIAQELQTKARGNLARAAVGNDQQLAVCDLEEEATGRRWGALSPLWLGESGEERQLVYVRRVWLPEGAIYQGFLTDWPALSAALLERARPLVTEAQLAPLEGDDPAAERTALRRLATVPALLVTTEPEVVPVSGLTPVRLTLSLSWFAVLAALSAVGFGIRASLVQAERRSRFASAVTHELRTPLTTFKLYTEMLTSGMVTDEHTRAEYLMTLARESDRLSRLVENVLAYSRLEQGNGRAEREELDAAQLLQRVLPDCVERARSGGMELVFTEGEFAGAARVVTDVASVAQILFNLVDNACKYAAQAADRRIELTAASRGDQLVITCRDRGPGIPEACARQVFQPFVRGENAPSDVAGIGLGLSLSLGLARDLGGDLLVEEVSPGAALSLSLPLASRA